MKALPINHTVLALGAVAALFAAYALLTPPLKVEGSVYDATRIGSATTTSAVSVNTSTRILATTTSLTGTSYTRVYASICTTSATPVGLNLDEDKATNATTGHVTTFIAAAAGYNACYEVTERNLYMGSITASSTSGAAVIVNVKDYVQ